MDRSRWPAPLKSALRELATNFACLHVAQSITAEDAKDFIDDDVLIGYWAIQRSEGTDAEAWGEIYDALEPRQAAPLNMAELASMAHFTAERVTTSRELSRARGKQSAMSGDQAAIFVDEHRIGPAPLADRGSNLRDLFIRVRAGVAHIGRDLLYRPKLAALGRPVLIHRCP